MPRLMRRGARKTSLPPGSVVFVGEKKTEATSLSIIDNDEGGFLEKRVEAIEECLPSRTCRRSPGST